MPRLLFVVSSCTCIVPFHLHRSFFCCVQLCFSSVTFFLFSYVKAKLLVCFLLYFFNDGNGAECVGLVVDFLLLSSFL